VKPKVMVVDDNLDILLSLRTVLEMEGYEVTVAENGWKCLRELEKGFKGVIILDLMMPVMNGFETLRNMIIEGFIAQNTVIVLTVKKIQGEEFDELYNYVYEYIHKPFDLDHLLKLVAKASCEPMK
jgi:DNA-binding response OmpR family regulator